MQAKAGLLGGALLAGLCGCSGFWDTVTAKGFRPKELFVHEDPMVVLRDSDSGDKRARALRALREPKQHGGSEKEQDVVLEVLTRSATGDPVPLCRLSAIQTLGQFKDPRAVRALSNAYYQATTFPPETATVVQVKSLEALGRTRNPDAVPLLATVLREPSPALDVPDQEKQQSHDRRAAAASALAHFSHYQGAQALVHVLKTEKDVALRNKAHEALVAATGKKLPPDGQAWEDMFQQAAAKGDKPDDSKVKLMSWFQK